MKVYLAGAITGVADYKEKFRNREELLQSQGFIVLNPANLPEGLAAVDYMRICFAMIDSADVVAFMPCYRQSRGAMVEYDYCQYTGKQTYYITEINA